MDGGPVVQPALREMGLVEFISHLEAAFRPSHQRRVTFFLGAGASRSSHIPTAGELVKKRWLPLLRQRARDESSLTLDDWARERYSDYDPQNPAALYGRLIDDAFPSSLDQQREIEHLVGLGRPGVGYGLLARFMGHGDYSRTVHTVLTTNFDDMVADALQIHVRKRARVIGHHRLAAFIQDHHATPQIVKLHGDAHLEPLNTTEETSSLPDGLLAPVKRILAETMLVFIGYGGGDHSVVKLLKGLESPPNAGVWWVNDKPPVLPAFHEWLAANKGRWVKHLDFDELMVLLAARFPDITFEIEDHFREDRENYKKSYEELSKRLNSAPAEEPGSSQKKAALDKVSSRLKTPWGLAARAWALSHDAPEEAERLYEKAVVAAPTDAGILGNYANFMADVRKDFDRAEDLYERALAAEPNHANNLGSYAAFMTQDRKNFARAEALYEQALVVESRHVGNLVNYANFLAHTIKNADRAEELFVRALDVDPEYGIALGSFALFLTEVRGDFDRAEELYDRAVSAAPEDANILANYGGFLLARGRADEGWEKVRAAQRAAQIPAERPILLELEFYGFVHGGATERMAALLAMREMVAEGVRSPGFDLSAHCAHAQDHGHPDAAMIAVLADVIADHRAAGDLDAFQSWTGAGI